jgi:SAM-dependent methyltransferase
MISGTAAEIEAGRLTQADVRLMDADEVLFPANSFDYVLCGFALHFLDYPRALVRFRQILRPGGRLAIMESYVPTEDRENMERWQWLFELTREVYPPDFVPPAYWTAPNRLNRPELIEAALHEAGFDKISVTSEETVMHFANEEEWWAWEWSQASRFWLEGMSPAGLAKFKAAAFERLCSMKSPQGIPMRWGALFAVAEAPDIQ